MHTFTLYGQGQLRCSPCLVWEHCVSQWYEQMSPVSCETYAFSMKRQTRLPTTIINSLPLGHRHGRWKLTENDFLIKTIFKLIGDRWCHMQYSQTHGLKNVNSLRRYISNIFVAIDNRTTDHQHPQAICPHDTLTHYWRMHYSDVTKSAGITH